MLSFCIWMSSISAYIIIGSFLLRKTWFAKGIGDAADLVLLACINIIWPIVVIIWVFFALCDIGVYLAEKGKDREGGVEE